MTDKIKERYKLYRAIPVVIKFPVDIDDVEYDKFRNYLFEMLFPVSIIEKYSPNIMFAIVPEGMVNGTIQKIKKFFAEGDITVDVNNYDVYIERK